jgi:hypothetical protein
MALVNAVITRSFDLFFAPFAYADPWLGLTGVSLLSALVLLTIFRYTSNQRAIRATKDRIIAHLLEVVLYRDELRVVLRAQVRLFRDSLRYLCHALVPLACMAIPAGVLLLQIDLRYGHRPLRLGEPVVAAVTFAGEGGSLDPVTLSAPRGVEVQTPALRILALREVDWRVAATAPGTYDLRVQGAGPEVTKRVVVGTGLAPISVERVRGGLREQFLHPGEAPLPSAGFIESVRICYPRFFLQLSRWRLHWIWPWLVLSMAFGYLLKGPLKVQV